MMDDIMGIARNLLYLTLAGLTIASCGHSSKKYSDKEV